MSKFECYFSITVTATVTKQTDIGALLLVPPLSGAIVDGDFLQWLITFGKFPNKIGLNFPSLYESCILREFRKY